MYNTNTGKLLHLGSYVIHEIADTLAKCFCVDLEEL